MRTTKPADQTRHLANSRAMFLRLLDVLRKVDAKKIENFRAERDYEGLEMHILETLLGK
jgi:xylose isomerase